jgi:hypothetical protein
MLACGYEPTRDSSADVNWRFRIKPRILPAALGQRGLGVSGCRLAPCYAIGSKRPADRNHTDLFVEDRAQRVPVARGGQGGRDCAGAKH